ncbi:hypothetical protein ACFVGX_30825 [Streptomyces sp. NPDC127113]|uniref:hypothetical protein n=1 Tax=Streptomyces sp. NPDC127113 TaxID=3345365 RepID=UPI00362D3D8B
MRQGPEIWIRGPVAAPELPDRGPITPEVPRDPAPAELAGFSWIGVHGGAGVTTLAGVFGGQDCGRGWPGPGDPSSVLLVARTHAAGLTAVGRAVEEFRLGRVPTGVGLDSVALVADAPGRLPRPLAQRVRLLESAVDVHRVPWVPAWRLDGAHEGPPRGTESLVRRTRRVR